MGLINKSKRNGWTLVESLVSVGIIGLMASIAIPTFMRAKKIGGVVSCQANLRNLYTSMNIANEDLISFGNIDSLDNKSQEIFEEAMFKDYLGSSREEDRFLSSHEQVAKSDFDGYDVFLNASCPEFNTNSRVRNPADYLRPKKGNRGGVVSYQGGPGIECIFSSNGIPSYLSPDKLEVFGDPIKDPNAPWFRGDPEINYKGQDFKDKDKKWVERRSRYDFDGPSVIEEWNKCHEGYLEEPGCNQIFADGHAEYIGLSDLGYRYEMLEGKN